MGVARSAAIGILALAVSGCGKAEDASRLRVGHFPNVTHAHGVIGHARSKAGKGWFEERVGQPVDWYVYNAGPSAMEALVTDNLDLSYVGPNPAINAYLKTGKLRVIAGATWGGAALVVHEGSSLAKASDFRAKKLATPQFGNTQDVSARAWLTEGGLKVTQEGGDARVIPAQNPEQLALFRSKDVDGVWTVEPWVSRLVLEAGGRLLVEERDAVTTVLVVRKRVLDERPDVVRKFLAAHVELTRWIAANADEARREVNAGLEAQTGAKLPDRVIADSWGRLRFDAAIDRKPFDEFLRRAQAAGFLRDAGSLEGLVATP